MMRNLLIFIVSLFCLTACSSTSNHQLDDNTLSNEDAMSKNVEGESNLETSKDTNAETGVEPSQVVMKPATEDRVETGGEKSIGSYFILNNEPTKKVIKSLEGVTEALNVMTFGIFATGQG
ncbi:conserved exported hypothetical protein [Vibrio crassostreae]|uniref:Uncharacterized protein n=1 Tax=Vibrio splendidus TaxID=29497 RepID=A0A2N7F6B7_VIBSP|nr:MULTISPECIES: hypothetical protein [Vibrio]PMH09832.1 hypothetical protein BCU75_12805 [Vibrio splendidus]PMJ61213.1 hypothetical protein BCU17_08680 [Vibrio splendidus]TCN91191.1 hypothetical protein EDB37_1003197 [Vibrio crassostreae]CAK2503273.1 conserved exported hypothetical protein [Vibrio crassostreae]CAK2511244.1 conserved exported hypothetical protein [Vibrio crassostreae]